MKTFLQEHKFALKWLGIAFVIKSLLFVFFAMCFHLYWPREYVNGIFNASGDTSVYYGAVESFYLGNGYDTNCRMPGLLPIYYPIRLLFDIDTTKAIIIILQFLTGVVSVYVLAQTARLLFNSMRIFYITFFLYAISSFVSIWDHVGYADSFGTSFLIFAVYLLVKNRITPGNRLILLSGLFMIWSLFFRPVHGILIPVIGLIFLFDRTNLSGTIKKGLLFVLPAVLFLGLWTYRNYSKYNKVIVLQGDMSACFKGLTKDLLSIRDLIVAWGGDSQPWAKNSEGEWFFGKGKLNNAAPSQDVIYASGYNLDSLKTLRQYYQLIHNDSTPDNVRRDYQELAVAASNRYIASYKKEHAFRYYFLNKLKLLKKFLFPKRLDDLPLPGFDKMNIFQKAVKIFYYLMLLAINLLGCIGCIIVLRKKIWLPLIPIALLITLAPVMGLIEQRYLVPVYGYFVIMTAVVIDSLYQYLQLRKQKRAV